MRRRMRGDAGATLLEVVLATTLMVIVMGATFTAVIVGTRNTNATRTQLGESHDTQLVETVLPQDLQSATTLLLNNNDVSGCSGSTGQNLITLRWSSTDSASTPNYSVSYRIVRTPSETQLIRYSCSGTASPPNTPPGMLVVGHQLLDPSKPPGTTLWASNPPTTCGSRVTVTVIEATQYQYTITGDSRVGITGTPTCSGTTSTTSTSTTSTVLLDPRPRLRELDMFDTNQNGKLDQLVARFSNTVPAACNLSSYWSLTNGPLGTTVGSVNIPPGNQKVLINLNEGVTAAAVDTAAPNLTVTFTPAGACTAVPFSGEHPIDLASPVVMSVTSYEGATGITPGDGKMSQNDRLVIGLSEPIPFSSTSVTATEASGDTLTITSVMNGTVSIGSGYVKGGNNSASWAGTASVTGTNLTILLSGTCSGACTKLTSGSGTFVYAPASTLVDANNNPVINPSSSNLPGANFKVF